MVAEYWHDREV
ncbi:hypothetical protein CDEST_15531 [Colletotrichum destructivum]|uniref:Uncharacterized protein n=1 Tax=Colletotrichum destructivum TaxID=34406 RepID=A0AAX4J4J5_9PEZI|nr:hypothetical protein CDEST_15531 [Colletotrichum destructivum]